MASTAASRFQLPALAPLRPLTEGTDIPPPPDSPIEEKRPSTPRAEAQTKPSLTPVTTTDAASKQNLDVPPISPASARQGSIRKFLSRKSLNSHYVNGTNSNISSENVAMLARPDSPSTFSTVTGPVGMGKKKRSWFSRFAGGEGKENKRASMLVFPTSEKVIAPSPMSPQPRAPPAPMLPELNQLKAKVDEDTMSLGGGDMFKGIN